MFIFVYFAGFIMRNQKMKQDDVLKKIFFYIVYFAG